MTTKDTTPVPRFNETDVEHLKDTPLHRGFFNLDRVDVRYRQYQGGWSETVSREVFRHHDAVGVLLYDVERDAVVLVEQFRAGAMGRAFSPWLLEPAAGLIDSEESSEDVARREVLEETGCHAQNLLEIHRYFPSPGACDEYITLYCALVDSGDLGGIHGLEEEHEDIMVRVLPFRDAWGLLEDGTINNAMLLIALYWLARERPALRARR
ncbi:NUDIX domain-containing protein [Kushneria indalinina]|uniref:ADP-ribose pyrophosphatase n=1 Tax=Kushneria indalinina DSM 14324 TaxID=1122140 RepID=A0A3D9DUE1_9GAMM|nr:NUDIX domain-containing protein [Kushneria indalinina]REC94383.1 ADP-ribose pyrophosphatase [Kushneria indalinina DSM 14324]